MASENAPSAKPDQPSLSLILLKAIVDEIHKAAHDPATVHLVADKLKGCIDQLEKVLINDQ